MIPRALAFLLLLALAATPAALAQHAIEASPNPYDSAVHDALVLRNAGTEPAALDSVAVLFRDAPYELAWWFGYTAYFGEERLRGWLECTHPIIHGSGVCVDRDGLYGRSLAPGDSVVLDEIIAGCGLCRGTNRAFSRTDDEFFARDTLLVYAGGAPEPLAVPLRQAAASSTEEGASASRVEIGVYPNPTRGAATLRLDLPSPARVEVRVFDVLGREVVALDAADLGPGAHRIALDASALASGLYVARAEASFPAGGRASLLRRFTVAR